MIVKKYKINTKKLELKNNVNTKLSYNTNSINKNIQVNVIAKQVIDLTDSMYVPYVRRLGLGTGNSGYITFGDIDYGTAPCSGYYMGWMFYPYGVENDIELVFGIVDSSIGHIGVAVDLRNSRRNEIICIIDVPLKKGMTITCGWYNERGSEYSIPGVGVGIYTGEIPSSFKTLTVTSTSLKSDRAFLHYINGTNCPIRHIGSNTYCSNKQQMFKKYGLIK